MNLHGDNQNPLVRRATIAHEFAHLLYDPDEYLNKVTVDTYEGLEYNPKIGPDIADSEHYHVEQRANAFAISFLAPKGVENFAADFFPIRSTPDYPTRKVCKIGGRSVQRRNDVCRNCSRVSVLYG